jgi:hypothetical protein
MPSRPDADRSAAQTQPRSLGDAWVIVQDGVTYVEADGVRRWLERADRDLARKWEANVDHLVRSGVERSTKRRWWPW